MIECSDLFEFCLAVVAQQRAVLCGSDVIQQRLRLTREYDFDVHRASLSRCHRWSAHTAGHVLDLAGNDFGSGALQAGYGRADLHAPAADLTDQRGGPGVRLNKLMDLVLE